MNDAEKYMSGSNTGTVAVSAEESGEVKTIEIRVRGRVQGVGFRPFICRRAMEHGIAGWVENDNLGVLVRAGGNGKQIEAFVRAIGERKPVAASIESLDVYRVDGDETRADRDETRADRKKKPTFTIRESRILSDAMTEVGPDIAVCRECLADMKQQQHRLDYPLINCTHCGPRFSIVRSIPYDRERTTMSAFEMCDTCRKEYEDIRDRRFHAQPVACNSCGPQYRFNMAGRKPERASGTSFLRAARLIDRGKILAVKGIGGYFLVCDAMNEGAVLRLRQRKQRDAKPFAVMFRDEQSLQQFASCSREEMDAIRSWRRPIVLLPLTGKIPEALNGGLATVGAMLPYMPVHYLLFERLRTPVLVMTSGNLSEEPVIKGDREAAEKLGRVADAFLYHDREISNRIDDSVVAVVNRKERLYRRSRGYVPQPVYVDRDVEGIFATGADLKGCFCIGKGNQAVMSQHIGDLENLETEKFYREALGVFRELYRFQPGLVVCDLHPDYFSTAMAAETGVPVIRAQHHHAHIVSCMAEHGLNGEVLGISMDGTGYGPDHQVWGGEFLICSRDRFKRYGHFDYVPLPGMDKAVKEPWRMGLVYLNRAFGEKLFDLGIPFTEQLERRKAEAVLYAADRHINTCMTSSSGRLFDAVAALLGICMVNRFEAEAPMRLEALMDPHEGGSYDIQRSDPLNFNGVIEQVVKDLRRGTAPPVISARFHHTVVSVFQIMARKMRDETGLTRVVLSGGTFQNRFLLGRTEDLLRDEGFEVFTHEQVPANDGGIALGQLMIGAAKKDQLCV